jgi:hypothetical protein
LLDPRNPDIILASTYQRRRHVWTLIDGGPGSGLHRSEDGGATWHEVSGGLPANDMGRIGLAAAPSDPDIVYAIIEADATEQGVYRSADFGQHWTRQSDRITSSPQYYNELGRPGIPARLYSLAPTQVSRTARPTALSFETATLMITLRIDPANGQSLYWW